MRLLAIVFVAVLATLLGGIPAVAADNTSIDKELIVDGSMVHDVGRLLLNVTNFGFFGATPGSPAGWSNAPSARWPDMESLDNLYAAGLWIGALKDEGGTLVPHVSTGLFENEIRATDEALDVIYESLVGVPGGARYPALDADDDGDGLEDEDQLDGIDNDGDGLIDEDYGRISDQYMRCEMRDYLPEGGHTALVMDVTQETFQWAENEAANMVGIRYTIRNAGPYLLQGVYLGFFMDADIGTVPEDPSTIQDDYPQQWVGTALDPDGGWMPIEIFSMRNDPFVHIDDMQLGIIVLDHTTEPGGVTAPATVGVTGARFFRGAHSYANGGDPTNDAERYESLAVQGLPDSWANADDYRILVSCGPFEDFAPGDELSFDLALIADDDPMEFLNHAITAVDTWRGSTFDRNGDPSDGEEVVVRWLRDNEIPLGVEDSDDEIPELSELTMSVQPNPFNPLTSIEFTLETPGRVKISAYDLAGHCVATIAEGDYPLGRSVEAWNGLGDDGSALSSGSYVIVLTAGDRVVSKKVSLVR